MCTYLSVYLVTDCGISWNWSLEVVVNYLMWILETKSGFSAGSEHS